MLVLVLFDTTECHGEHDDEGKSAAEFHFGQPADVVAFEAEAYVESAVDAFDGSAFFSHRFNWAEQTAVNAVR